MAAFSYWLKGLFGNDSRRAAKRKPVRRRPILAVERLEDRLTPALQLLYGGPGTALSLGEVSSGNDTVTVSELGANRLRISLGGNTFAAGSSASPLFVYETGNAQTSHFVEVNHSAANTISTLALNLGAGSDTLALGFTNAAGGVGNVTVTDSVGRDTLINFNSLALRGGNLNISGGQINANPGAIIATNGGDLTLTGTGAAAATFGSGISAFQVTFDSGGGDLALAGTGGAGALVGEGISANQVTFDSGGGDLTLTGTGGAGAGLASGIFGQLLTFDAGGGDLRLTATGGANGSTSGGISASTSVIRTVGSGTITLNATANGSQDDAVAINFSQVTTVDGDLSITGVSQSGGRDSSGIQAVGSVFQASGSGNVTLHGTGGAGDNFNSGVELVGHPSADLRVATGTGDVSITGISRGTGSDNFGVTLSRSTANVTTAGGNLSITGVGGPGQSSSAGINIADNAVVQAGGSGTVTLHGTGSAGPNLHPGVNLTSRVTAGAGDPTQLLGLAPGSTLIVDLDPSRSAASGYVFVNANGPVDLNGATLDVRAAGPIPLGTTFRLINNEGNGPPVGGAFAQGGSLVVGGQRFVIDYAAFDGNDVSLTRADRIHLSYGGTGTALSITDPDGGDNRVVVSEASPNQLRIQLEPGIVFDPTSSQVAGLTYEYPGSPASSRYAEVNITAANSISTLALDLGAGRDTLTLGLTPAAGGVRNLTVTDSAGSDTLIDLSSVLLPGGDLNVSGGPILVRPFSAITTQGGDLTLTGTGTAARIVGIEIDNATLDAGGGDILLTGTGAAGTSFAYGLFAQRGAVIQTGGSGTLTLTGTGGNGEGSNLGVDLSGVLVTSADGDLVINGVGQGSQDSNTGVNLSGIVRATGTGNLAVTGTSLGRSGSNVGVEVQAGTVVQTSNGTVTLAGTGSPSATSAGVRIRDGGRITAAGGDPTKALGLAPGSAVVVDLSSDRGSASSYSFVQVEGTVDLGGASLQATAPGAIPAGTAFRLVNNDGADPVVGTFAQGSSLTVAGRTFAIDYAAFDGNDVSLTAVQPLLLTYGGAGTPLSLSELTAGDDNVTVYEPTPGMLRIDLGTGTFAAASSIVAGLTYEVPGSPTASNYVDVDISTAFAVADLAIDLGAGSDFLELGLTNAAGGVFDVTVTDSVGRDTAIDLNTIAIDLGNLSVTGGPIYVAPGAVLTTLGGDITLNGTGNALESHGVQVEGATLDAGGGHIRLTGTGAASPSFAYGVYAHAGAVIRTDGTGTVTLDGTSGNGDFNIGVYLDGFRSDVEVTTGVGALAITGVSQGSGPGQHGVQLVAGRVTTAGGDLTITGVGQGADGGNTGIEVFDGAAVRAGGSGKLTLYGTAGNGPDGNVGVLLESGQLTTAGGDLVLTGVGRGTGSGNDGIDIFNDTVVQAGGSGKVTLAGTGTASSAGVRIRGGGRVTAGGGDPTKALGLAPGSSIVIALDVGRAAASGYEFVHVEGTVDLGGATLQATRSGTIPDGTSFRLLNNDGTADGNSAFAQGGMIVTDGQTFSINYAGGDGNDVVLTAVRPAGVTITPTSGLTTTESGGTATFLVVLDSPPVADVTVTFTSLDPTEGAVTTTLTFSPANWNVAQTVTVTGVDDALADGDVSYLVRGTVASPDPLYDGLPVADVAVVNVNDDALVVESVRINDGAAQRSRVTSITVTFNGDVALDPGAITLARSDGSLVELQLTTAVIDGRTVVTVTFVGGEIVAGSLADGTYRLTIDAGRVRTPAQALSAGRVVDFHRLFGDSDGDRDVDSLDAFRFRSALLGAYVSYFDYDGDGDVDADDQAQFNLRRGTGGSGTRR